MKILTLKEENAVAFSSRSGKHLCQSAVIRNTIEQPLIGIQAMHNNTGFHSAGCENKNTVGIPPDEALRLPTPHFA